MWYITGSEPVYEARCDEPEEILCFLNQEVVRNVSQYSFSIAQVLGASCRHAFLHVVFPFVRVPFQRGIQSEESSPGRLYAI